ncbi:hypothetical protein, partial [Rothia nasimurium]|uniref:hypothetical protein n=1 Tax=Rothia nasimurium TaxID=85336 RepID=UPI001F2364F4
MPTPTRPPQRPSSTPLLDAPPRRRRPHPSAPHRHPRPGPVHPPNAVLTRIANVPQTFKCAGINGTLEGFRNMFRWCHSPPPDADARPQPPGAS